MTKTIGYFLLFFFAGTMAFAQTASTVADQAPAKKSSCTMSKAKCAGKKDMSMAANKKNCQRATSASMSSTSAHGGQNGMKVSTVANDNAKQGKKCSMTMEECAAKMGMSVEECKAKCEGKMKHASAESKSEK